MRTSPILRNLGILAAIFALYGTVVAQAPSSEAQLAPPADVPVSTGDEVPANVLAEPAAQSRIEVVFVLDTTGSMTDLIEAAKSKIWSIATTLATAEPTPLIHMGLVGYRDIGDAYVTQVIPMTDNLDQIYTQLMAFRADGGGDGPESVNAALHQAVHGFPWSTDSTTYRAIFLVGDAPPHMDYDEVQYPTIVAEAMAARIFVNTVQCGAWAETTPFWTEIARLGEGHYFQVDQSGGAIVQATPYDEELARLARELDETRLFYGTVEQQQESAQLEELAHSIYADGSIGAQARRAVFNVSGGGEANFLGSNELVNDWQEGRVSLEELPIEQLPATLQGMSLQERSSHLEQLALRRAELTGRIQELSGERQSHLAEIAAEQTRSGEVVLDDGIYRAVRAEAASAGISFASDAPAY